MGLLFWLVVALIGSSMSGAKMHSGVAAPPYGLGQGDSTPQEKNACRAEVESGVMMHVDVDPEKEYFPPPNNTRPLYLDKESKEWILIKQNAGLPAWKIENGYAHCRFADPNQKIPPNIPKPQIQDYCLVHGGAWIHETERIGKTVEEGKDVYIGLGHCNGDPEEDCLDPLVQDALFVLEKEGRPWSEVKKENVCHPWPKAKSEECNRVQGFWWKFNVYLDKQAFADADNPSYDGLPCWAKLACAGDMSTDGGRRRRDAMKECQGVQAVTSTTSSEVLQSSGDLTSERLTGESFDGAEVGSILTYLTTFTPTPVWQGGSTIKLGTFNPIPHKFAYEWWTPSCKPAIYLYPRKRTRLRVLVEPKGKLIKTIPEYPKGGWNIVAYPDGSLREYTTYKSYSSYPYLFYEANIKRLKLPHQGWVVVREELPSFFDQILLRLGLNFREIRDFKQYWTIKLSDAPYYFVGLIDRDELDKVEAISLSREPDVFIRVRFLFEKLFAPLSIKPPALPDKPGRDGFVAVDWGGILIDDTCEEVLVR